MKKNRVSVGLLVLVGLIIAGMAFLTVTTMNALTAKQRRIVQASIKETQEAVQVNAFIETRVADTVKAQLAIAIPAEIQPSPTLAFTITPYATATPEYGPLYQLGDIITRNQSQYAVTSLQVQKSILLVNISVENLSVEENWLTKKFFIVATNAAGTNLSGAFANCPGDFYSTNTTFWKDLIPGKAKGSGAFCFLGELNKPIRVELLLTNPETNQLERAASWEIK